jgi:hypothetical protein
MGAAVKRLGRLPVTELPEDDHHDVIHVGGEVVAVVVPLEEYRRLRLAEKVADAEALIDAQFDASHADYLVREAAGAVEYVSSAEARRRLGLPAR